MPNICNVSFWAANERHGMLTAPDTLTVRAKQVSFLYRQDAGSVADCKAGL